MSHGAVSRTPWAPLPDDQLSWFRADQSIFATPRPLDFTLEIHALVFGLTYALESIEFPLYALRSRLVHGRVYLAAVPSATAEGDLAQRLKNIHDQSLRFTKNIQHVWERQIKPEVETYNRWFDEVASFTGSSTSWPVRFASSGARVVTSGSRRYAVWLRPRCFCGKTPVDRIAILAYWPRISFGRRRLWSASGARRW